MPPPPPPLNVIVNGVWLSGSDLSSDIIAHLHIASDGFSFIRQSSSVWKEGFVFVYFSVLFLPEKI